MSFQSVRDLLEQRVPENPGKDFLFSELDGRSWTYAEFDQEVNRTANMLIKNEIRKGDVVTLLLPNSAEYVIAYFACWKTGALAGPVNSLLKPEEIEWIEAAGNYVRLHVGAEGHLLRETMNSIEARLNPETFFRIHRSHIVNIERIKELQPWFNGEYVVILRNGARLTLSRGYREKLQEKLGKPL